MVSNKEEYRMADLLFGQQVEDDLDQLNLSAKTRACLVRAGITTLIEVFELNDKQLSLIPHMTKTMVKEVKAKIADYLKATAHDVFSTSPIELDDDFEEI